MFEDVWGTSDPDELPTELLEKIRLAFLILQHGHMVEETSDHIVLHVPKELYEEFLSPMSDHTIQ